jgi:hypothetical protein
MTMIPVDTVHEIIAIHGELPEDFIVHLMNSDGERNTAGLSMLTHFSLVLASRIFVYRQNPNAVLALRFRIPPFITGSS